MLDKDAALNLLIRDADLELELSGNYLKMVDKIEIISEKVEIKTFSVFGYSCIAPDLPGMGKTGGHGVQEDCRAGFIDDLLYKLSIKEVIIVASSMSGQYIIPLLNNANNHQSPFHLVALVAIGLSDTNQLCPDHLAQLVTPCLVLRGMFDTSIGLNASNVLSLMPHSRIVVVPNGRHLCHYSNPQFFHKVTLNFLDVVLKNVTKSIFVTDL